MKFTYREYDGRNRFLNPDELFAPPEVIRFILHYGQDGLDALPDADEQVRTLIEQMIQAGLLERDENGALRLTPRMVKGIEHTMFLEIFREMKAGHRGGHEAIGAGPSAERIEGTKPYEFGDPMSELALNETMRNAIQRRAREGAGPENLLPLTLRDSDFEVHRTEATGESAIVLLLDLSGSMMRYGRYIQAKRVALGLKSLIARRFPMDTLHFVGFSSVAERIAEKDLPLILPKPITIRDWEVRLRVPLDQAGDAPPHFTNLHHGLRMARSILMRQGAPNKQIFIITDGQPTAHVERGEAGEEMLYLLYPPNERTTRVTLEEALRCTQAGIRMSTFALIEDYYYMDWVNFVEQMTRLVRGVAYYCTAGDLTGVVMESYLSGKKAKVNIGQVGR